MQINFCAQLIWDDSKAIILLKTPRQLRGRRIIFHASHENESSETAKIIANQSQAVAWLDNATHEERRAHDNKSRIFLFVSTHVSDCLNGVDVIHLGCHQLPDRWLNLRICVWNITSINEIPPRLRQAVKRIKRFVWVFGINVGRLRFRDAISHVCVEQLAELILLWILYTRDGKHESNVDWQLHGGFNYTLTPKSCSDHRCFVCLTVVVLTFSFVSMLSSVDADVKSRLVVDR